MKLISGLFRAVRKSLSTNDNDMGQFREKLTALVKGKDGMTDEEISAKVEEIKGYTEDLPESEEKSTLMRYLEDMKAIKGQDMAVVEKAAVGVADLFEKLDTLAMKDMPAAPGVVEEEKTEEVVEETKDPETADEEKVEQTEVKEEVKDDDPIKDYPLEEIYSFIKSRLAKDGCIKDEDKTEVVEEKKEEVVEDHAPAIPLAKSSSADEEFFARYAEFKKTRR